jgi:hypothetical protein
MLRYPWPMRFSHQHSPQQQLADSLNSGMSVCREVLGLNIDLNNCFPG